MPRDKRGSCNSRSSTFSRASFLDRNRDTIAAMRWLLLPVSLLAAAAAFFAQTAPPNPTGISAGHIHIVVADPAAYQKTIISVLGGTPVNAGPLTMVKLPGIFFIMT